MRLKRLEAEFEYLKQTLENTQERQFAIMQQHRSTMQSLPQSDE